MSAARPLWRALAAMLQIAALIVVSMPGPGHAHPSAHEHAGSAAAGIHCHDRAGPSLGSSGHDHRDLGASHAPERHDGSERHAPCSCACACQSVMMGTLDAAIPAATGRPVALRGPPERPFASLSPEALPEPPRTFA